MGVEIVEELKKTNKYLLSPQESFNYFKDVLEDVNHVSTLILKLIENQPGVFFTVLPKNANLEQLYQFKSGGILPQFPDQEMVVNGCRSTFCWIPDVRDEIANLISKEISVNQLCCVIDSVSARPNDKYYTLYSDDFSVFFGDEVYYLIKRQIASSKLISERLRASNSFWHSLGILSRSNLEINGRNLNLNQIEDVCSVTQVAFVGAYDGEGYLFWEREKANEGRGVFSDIPLLRV